MANTLSKLSYGPLDEICPYNITVFCDEAKTRIYREFPHDKLSVLREKFGPRSPCASNAAGIKYVSKHAKWASQFFNNGQLQLFFRNEEDAVMARLLL